MSRLPGTLWLASHHAKVLVQLPNVSLAAPLIDLFSLQIGACMETFMYFTGFYDIVTRKEAERFVEGRQFVEQNQILAQLAAVSQKTTASTSDNKPKAS